MKREALADGDLLFLAGQSELDQAVQAATGEYSHVGIYLAGQVYHATSSVGVVKVPLDEFLQEGMVCQVYEVEQINPPLVLKRAEEQLGQPYNSSFYPDGVGYYCSQFVAEILPIFETIPMEFGDDKSAIIPFWQDYYDQLGLPVPLGLPGTNPSQLAQSQYLRYKGKIND